MSLQQLVSVGVWRYFSEGKERRDSCPAAVAALFKKKNVYPVSIMCVSTATTLGFGRLSVRTLREGWEGRGFCASLLLRKYSTTSIQI